LRHVCVGDIHGAGKELKSLLEDIQLKPDDKLILVGDIFDRGEDADVVWEVVQQYNADVMLGNHERKYLQYITGDRKWLPTHYHYAWDILSRRMSLQQFKIFLASLPLVKRYYRGDGLGSFIVAHGGVNIDNPSSEDLSANVYARLHPDKPTPIPQEHETYWWDLYKGEELVLYGHLATYDGQPRVRIQNNKVNSIGLDTGAVHGGPLTAYCVEEERFYSYQSGIDHWKSVREKMKLNKPQQLIVDRV